MAGCAFPQASSADGKDGGLEFVKPPAESQPGERIYFEGEKYESGLYFPDQRNPTCASEFMHPFFALAQTPETQLNPKKKIFETIQPVSSNISPSIMRLATVSRAV